MKPNKKTLGGFVALVVPDKKMSWEAYKAEYGIDLDKIFKYVPEDGVSIVARKPILICLDQTIYGNSNVPVSALSRVDFIDNGEGETNLALIGAQGYSSGQIAGYIGVRVNIDRTVEAQEL